jgi:hypothetical protein
MAQFLSLFRELSELLLKRDLLLIFESPLILNGVLTPLDDNAPVDNLDSFWSPSSANFDLKY